MIRFTAPGALVLFSLAGCGDDLGPVLHVTPAEAALKVGGTARFEARDDRGDTVAATFSVIGAGSIDDHGRYQAPATPTSEVIRAHGPASPGPAGEARALVSAYQGQLADLPVSSPRFSHTLTLLDDGSVLIVGSPNDTTAERFLPAARSFQPAGDLGARIWKHSATALTGASVLIAGGRDLRSAFGAAVTYESGHFVPVANPMRDARFAHTASALASGEVLVVGGQPLVGTDVPALASAELYTPATRGFRAAATMGSRRSGHTATRLRDGRVLVAGGRDSTCLVSCPQVVWASAELYDPVTDRFAPTGSMALARFDHTATLLDDGRVVIAGGTTPDLPATDIADTVEIYDPATGRFSPAGALHKRRTEHTATLLGDGRILFAHGRSEGDGTVATATMEAFDPATGASTLTTSLRTTRYSHAALRLDAGQVLLVGGTEGGGAITTAELYD